MNEKYHQRTTDQGGREDEAAERPTKPVAAFFHPLPFGHACKLGALRHSGTGMKGWSLQHGRPVRLGLDVRGECGWRGECGTQRRQMTIWQCCRLRGSGRRVAVAAVSQSGIDSKCLVQNDCTTSVNKNKNANLAGPSLKSMYASHFGFFLSSQYVGSGGLAPE